MSYDVCAHVIVLWCEFCTIDDVVPCKLQAVNSSALTQVCTQKDKGTDVKMASGMYNVNQHI